MHSFMQCAVTAFLQSTQLGVRFECCVESMHLTITHSPQLHIVQAVKVSQVLVMVAVPTDLPTYIIVPRNMFTTAIRCERD